MSERIVEQVQPAEIVANPSLLERINETYIRVFSDEKAFRQYFFSTPDLTVQDVQVRIGVVLKRLEEDNSERFWFLRQHFRDTDFGGTSIHNFDNFGGIHYFPNGHFQAEKEEWEKRQPSEREKILKLIMEIAKNEGALLLEDGGKDDGVIYNYPKVVLTTGDIEEAVATVLPYATKRASNYETVHEVEINTPKFKTRIIVTEHEDLGCSAHFIFHDDDMKIDDGIQGEYVRYYQDVVIPNLIENAIRSLRAGHIWEHSLRSRIGKGKVAESVFWRPKTFYGREGADYTAEGYCVDLINSYAQVFGLIPKGRWADYTSVGGWFICVPQLYESLFGRAFPGYIPNSVDRETVTLAISANGRLPATHQRVLDSFGPDQESDTRRANEFIETAEIVSKDYRLFVSEDLADYKFPRGFTPIAVARNCTFAIGFRQVEDGVEVCFQLTRGQIIEQAEDLIGKNKQSIVALKKRNKELGSLIASYK